MEITCGKRKFDSTFSGDSKRSKPGEDGGEKRWCHLTRDVLELIFQRLNFRDLARAKLVCSHWLSVSKYVESLLVPLLLVPHQNNLCLFNLEDKNSVIMKNNVGFDFCENSCCLMGSSHGCIIYLDEEWSPFVLNPWTGSKIQLPELLHKNRNESCMSWGFLRTHAKDAKQHWLREVIVHKAILSSNPFNGGDKFSVAVIYSPHFELAYINMEDYSWTRLDQENYAYRDIIFHENKLYAVEGVTDHVVVWDISGIRPKKLMKLKLSIPRKSCEVCNFSGCDWKSYLVESRGKILLIKRHVEDHTDGNGNVVLDLELVPSETNQPLVFPYGTVEFCVFELDMLKKQLIEVKSLDGCALFLGGNHSLSISVGQDLVRCKQNSIYFTDDNWERMDEDSTYGGHDIGVFDMSVRKVTVFDRFRGERIQPSPCWILPQQIFLDDYFIL